MEQVTLRDNKPMLVQLLRSNELLSPEQDTLHLADLNL
jgi:hypothetical protein